MKARIFLSTLILLLAGCTGVRSVNTDATHKDFDDDKAECTQQVLKASIETHPAMAETSSSPETSTTTPPANKSLRKRIEACLQSMREIQGPQNGRTDNRLSFLGIGNE